MDSLLTIDYAEKQKPNFAGFAVIGAGLPRTGTMSLRAALGKLLDGQCYHMLNVGEKSKTTLEDAQFWNDILDGKKGSREDWVKFLEGRGFRSGVDFPISMFYRELMRAFPDAKVVLTKRNPATWYTSVQGSIYQLALKMRSFSMRTILWLGGILFNAETVVRVSSAPIKGFPKGMFPVIEAGEEASVEFFNKWMDEVIKTVPKERLLIFECKEGWEPLCKFLDLPIPDEPFPRVNDTKAMLSALDRVEFWGNVLVYGLPTILAAGAAFAYHHFYNPFF